MDEKLLVPARHWGVGRIFLVVAVCFVLATIVFFVSAWLQQYWLGGLNQNTAVQLSDEEKRDMVDRLSATTPPNKTSPEEKLEILQSLNAN